MADQIVEGLSMADRNDYRFANLRPELVERVQRLETELSGELDEPVILLAYDKRDDADEQR